MNSLLNCFANLFSCCSELPFTICNPGQFYCLLILIYSRLGFFFLLGNKKNSFALLVLSLLFLRSVGSLSPLFEISDEPPCCVVPVLDFGIYSTLLVYMFGTCMSRVWLHVFGPVNTELTQFFTHSLGFL